MGKTLFVSTETSGMWKFKLHDDFHPTQPRMVRIAWAQTDDDGNLLDADSILIYPESAIDFEPGAVNAHGIDFAIARGLGMPLNRVMQRYAELHAVSDLLVAFGLEFQLKVLRRECRQAGVEVPAIPAFCAMKECKELVRKPRMAPGGGLSPFVGLAEAYRHFTGRELPVTPPNPMDAGAVKVECIKVIYDGIMSARAVSA